MRDSQRAAIVRTKTPAPASRSTSSGGAIVNNRMRRTGGTGPGRGGRASRPPGGLGCNSVSIVGRMSLPDDRRLRHWGRSWQDGRNHGRQQRGGHPSAGQGPVVDRGRLEAFSDGVIAVANTLLALNLAVGGPGPHQLPLAANLADHWPVFAAYAVSFATIGIIWVNHHTLFKNFSEIDRTLLFVNLLLLFFVVSVPFATSTIAAYLRASNADASLAAAIYQGVFEGVSISFTVLLWWAIRRGHLKVALAPERARRATIRFGIGNLGYIAGIGIAFVSAPASLVLSGLIALYYIFEQTPVRAQPPPDQNGPHDNGGDER